MQDVQGLLSCTTLVPRISGGTCLVLRALAAPTTAKKAWPAVVGQVLKRFTMQLAFSAQSLSCKCATVSASLNSSMDAADPTGP